MTISWEQLNAYVDAELDPESAAEVASAIARDPDLAARAASLMHLKATLHASSPAYDHDDVPPVPLPSAPPRQRRMRAPLAAMAVVLLVIAAGLATVWGPGASRQAWLADAVAAQKMWLAGGGAGGRVRVEDVGGAAVSVPDLTAAELRLVYLSGGAGRGRGVFLGYRGTRGCRYGLWIDAAHPGAGDRPPARHGIDGVAIRTWSTAAARYAFLARGADPQRLDRLAHVVARLTRRQDDPERLRLALREAGQVGRTCAA